MIDLLLGVDGGGTGCRARLADLAGRTLGEGAAGPANLTTGFDAALASVVTAFGQAAAAAGLDPAVAAPRVGAVLGLAGAASLGDGGRVGALLPFRAATVRADSEIACLGAHGGRPGGLVVLGTGSQAVMVDERGLGRFGGWGFLLSDGASGAVLGQAALRGALAAHEGLAPPSGFTRHVMARFDDDPRAMARFAATARPADYAAFAPAVFSFAEDADPVAAALRDAAVQDVERLVVRLVAAGATRIALSGGLAARYGPLLTAGTTDRLTAPEGGPLDGALALAGRLHGAGGRAPPP